MGNCNFRSETDNISSNFFNLFLIEIAISKTNFIFQYVIGKGGFGKVYYF